MQHLFEGREFGGPLGSQVIALGLNKKEINGKRRHTTKKNTHKQTALFVCQQEDVGVSQTNYLHVPRTFPTQFTHIAAVCPLTRLFPSRRPPPPHPSFLLLLLLIAPLLTPPKTHIERGGGAVRKAVGTHPAPAEAHHPRKHHHAARV
jgi:hypothetical protein